MDLDVLHTVGDGVGAERVRDRSLHPGVDQLMLDLAPRAVRRAGVGHLQRARLVHPFVEHFVAPAVPVGEPGLTARELRLDEVTRPEIVRDPPAQEDVRVSGRPRERAGLAAGRRQDPAEIRRRPVSDLELRFEANLPAVRRADRKQLRNLARLAEDRSSDGSAARADD
jgi:hypothetical protein